MTREVIIKPGYSYFTADSGLEDVLQSCGYENWYNIGARMDSRIIEYIKENGTKTDRGVVYEDTRGKTLEIVEVDTSRMWIIDEYDGSESIEYVEVVASEVGYCELRMYE